jgi:hypothetical protein
MARGDEGEGQALLKRGEVAVMGADACWWWCSVAPVAKDAAMVS